MGSPTVSHPIASPSPIGTTLVLQQPTPAFQSSSGGRSTSVQRLERTAERLSLGGVDLSDEIHKIWQEEKLKDTSTRPSSGAAGYDNTESSASPVFESEPLQNQPVSNSDDIESVSTSPITPVSATSTISKSWRRTTHRRLLSPKYLSNSSVIAPLEEAESEPGTRKLLQQDSLQTTPSQTSKDPLSKPAKEHGSILKDSSGSRGNVQPPWHVYLSAKSPENTAASVTSGTPPSTPESHSSYSSSQFTYRRTVLKDYEKGFRTKASSDISLNGASSRGLYQLGRMSFEKSLSDAASYKTQSSGCSGKSRSSSKTRQSQLLRWNRAPPGEKMVYYPAPVPMTLNLPKRLSQQTSTTSPLSLQSQTNQDYLSSTKDLPPQLRASVFFERSSMTHEIEVKHGSAVATLDSLLDASVTSPVAGFRNPTPMVVPKAPQDDSTMPVLSDPIANLRKNRGSMFLPSSVVADGVKALDRASKRKSMFELGNSAPPSTSKEEHISTDTTASEAAKWVQDLWADTASSPPPNSKPDNSETTLRKTEVDDMPTNLLAELQLRKQQQNQRVRNAFSGSANNGGMHAILLDLEAVDQIAQSQRQAQRTMLAWERPVSTNGRSRSPVDQDEDVPLGLTFGGDSQHRPADLNHSLTLLEQRGLHDSEPLSKRRNRLQKRNAKSPERAITMASIRASSPTKEDKKLEQRAHRLKKSQSSSGPILASTDTNDNGDFSVDLLRKLGVPARPVLPPSSNSAPELPHLSSASPKLPYLSTASPKLPRLPSDSPKLPPLPPSLPPLRLEETVAQRRARLQQSSAAKPLPPIPGPAEPYTRTHENRTTNTMPPSSYRFQSEFHSPRPSLATLLASNPLNPAPPSSTPPPAVPQHTSYAPTSSPPIPTPTRSPQPLHFTPPSHYSQPYSHKPSSISPPPPPIHNTITSQSFGLGLDTGVDTQLPPHPDGLLAQNEHQRAERRWAILAQNARSQAFHSAPGGGGYGVPAQERTAPVGWAGRQEGERVRGGGNVVDGMRYS